MTVEDPGQRQEDPGMWQEFRRRRVTRTVLLYLVFAFLAVEAFLVVDGLITLPPWSLRAVVGAAVLGFPLTVVLAWSYDVTPSGIVKTPEELEPEPPPSLGPELGWLILGGSALAVALVLRFLRL